HPPHPEARRSRLEGGLQGSRGRLEASFEASAALRHLQDEGAAGMNAATVTFRERTPTWIST
ncbi:hypothetical protein, partial [Methylobacterium sp. WL7]|uniref:hypothetical protein n=1 Tax=Methylobacterium sp. WL7 TaxID=2603900 RepID=UPI001AEE6D03